MAVGSSGLDRTRDQRCLVLCITFDLQKNHQIISKKYRFFRKILDVVSDSKGWH